MKYLKIENDNITEIDEDIIKKELYSKYHQTVEMEQYCCNCEYFCAPAGCTNMMVGTVPFYTCYEWSKATDEEIEATQKEINECCKVNPLKKIRDYQGILKRQRADIYSTIDNIIKLAEFVEYDELRPEFIKEMREIGENDNITPHKLNKE